MTDKAGAAWRRTGHFLQEAWSVTPSPVRWVVGNRAVQLLLVAAGSGIIGNRTDAAAVSELWPWLTGRAEHANAFVLGFWVLVVLAAWLVVAGIRFSDARGSAARDLDRERDERREWQRKAEQLQEEMASLSATHKQTPEIWAQEKGVLVAQLEDARRGRPVALAKYQRALDACIGWERLVRSFRRSLGTAAGAATSQEERDTILVQGVKKILSDTCKAIGGRHCNQASLLQPVAGEPYLEVISGLNLPEESRHRRFYCGTDPDLFDESGVAGDVFRSGQGTVVQDVLADRRYIRTAGRDDELIPYRSMICEPIVTSERTHGVVCMLGKETGCFDEDIDAQIVRLAAAVLSRAFIIYDETAATAQPAVTVSSPGGGTLSAEQENGARS